jgi:O-antigen/teichoic acid export membrane protein
VTPSPPNSADARSIVKRASIAAAAGIYQQGVTFVSGLVIARVIGAGDYGIFNLARNLVDVAAIVSRLGLEIGLQRHFGEAASSAECTRRCAVLAPLRLVAFAVALLPVVAVALGLGELLEAVVYRYPGFEWILLCLALTLPFVTDLAILGGAYRGVLWVSRAVFAEAVLLPTIRLVAVGVLFIVGWRLWAVTAGTMLAALSAATFLAVRARVDFGAETTAVSNWPEALRVIRYSAVMAAAVLVTTLTATIDVFVLGRFATAAELGRYSLIKTLLLLMGLIGGAFNQTTGALVAGRHSRADPAGIVRVLSTTTRWVAFGTVPLLAMFLMWGSSLTLVFGPSFSVSAGVVGWLAAGQFLRVVLAPAGWALSMTGRHVLELEILAAGLIVAALVCALVAPEYGTLGAAVATCAATGLTNLTRALAVRRNLGRLPFGRDVVVITATGIALAMASDWLAARWHLSGEWRAVVGGCGFVVAYVATVWACLLTPSERRGIRSAVATTTTVLLGRSTFADR